MRNCGIINPLDIEEYIGVGGYRPLLEVLKTSDPEETLKQIKESGLRGRGGAGFPVWLKWHLIRENNDTPKYIICNADEGDPGAYMNRNELEGDPHMVIEGMIIGGFVTGASEGIIYCRAEYPLAVEHLNEAVSQARRRGFLGKNIAGTGFDFEISLIEGAGAFVCGAETALISSVEGHPGWPSPRPPYPSESGLYGKPTCINNVETFANIPMIVSVGGREFAKTGTGKSSGTKVFSLVGKVKNTGLVELPLGTPIRKLIYDIGGGAPGGKKIKAVQTGGPSGGCIPVSEFNSPIDYESLAALGSIMGSGGVVIMDQDNCMVDVANYFTEFTTSESCGKCVPCREGLSHVLDMLEKIKRGEGKMKLLDELAQLNSVICDTALCGLGQTGPNPVMTTIKYFLREYEEHIREGFCDAGVCEELFSTPCGNSCPVHMNIPGYLQLLLEERIEEAFELIVMDNPLPSSIGRICHFHCKMRCRREDIDAPVAQGEVHRYIADAIAEKGLLKEFTEKIKSRRLKSTGKKIAVIGAGPAGLTAAFYLNLLGNRVRVYDAREEPGGILRWGIPAHRLPREVLAREVEFIASTGVKFSAGRDLSAKDIAGLREKNDAVLMATGAYASRALGVPGEELKGVIAGTRFLEDIASGRKPEIGGKVLVIGGGNVAIDAARTARRLGSEVTVVYRRSREQMPANASEIEDAAAEKVKFLFWRSPEEILADKKGLLKGLRVSLNEPGEYDLSGRIRPVATGKSVEIPADTVISAIGETVDREFLASCGLDTDKWGNIAADPFTFENKKGVYAAGDAVTGPGTAVEAMSQAKKAAFAIDAALSGKDRRSGIFRKPDYENRVPEKPRGGGPVKVRKLSTQARVKGFEEVSKGLGPDQARREARRCLRCDVRISDGE